MAKAFTATLFVLLYCSPLDAQSSDSAADSSQPAVEAPTDVLPGHSYHGEFLNEGPRQKASLMKGTGPVCFPVTSSNDQVRAFVEQGIGQVYGFWYLEAERSFRQAASLDPDCAIAYWGAALATLGNEKRSRGFIAEAVKRKEKASDRERMYVDALDAYLKAGKSKPEPRDAAYRKALEEIALKYPDDLEAKALLALQLYNNRKDGDYLAIDAFMQQIFAVEPLHSAHHFRIHLWDKKKPELALSSAAVCGQGSPAIAHMWHMPGHIYSRLKRYDDACWQQEASARVDHAHMIRDRLLPDQIHNYAHNNEWLIRNLNHAGRVRDAVELAKNMVELPRHPKYNTLKRGSSHYGRLRLFETLERYELWDETIELCLSAYLEPTDDEIQQAKRLRHLATALVRTGDVESAQPHLEELRSRLQAETAKRDDAVAQAEAKAAEKIHQQTQPTTEQTAPEQTAPEQTAPEQPAPEQPAPNQPPTAAKEPIDGDQSKTADSDQDAAAKAGKAALEKHQKEIEKAKKDAAQPFEAKVRELENAVHAVEGQMAAERGDFQAALPVLRKAGGVDPIYVAGVQYRAGETKAALEAARKHAGGRKNEVQPQAGLIELLWLAGEKEAARTAFDQLREISSQIDMASPVFQRLVPIAEELGFPADWRAAGVPRDDVGRRPDLNSLGPFRWEPFAASDWELADANGKEHSLRQFSGKPVVVIFYLGYGCLHCNEQLQAFAPKAEAFREAGIEWIAISTDDAGGLKQSIENYDKGTLPIPLVSDASLEVFKEWRVYDDFEQQPLHGTFVIDPEGLVLWQDISHEPFMDPEFVLTEAQRLLAHRAARK